MPETLPLVGEETKFADGEENRHTTVHAVGLSTGLVTRCRARLSHPEIFEFQDVIKIKNKTTFFSQF